MRTPSVHISTSIVSTRRHSEGKIGLIVSLRDISIIAVANDVTLERTRDCDVLNISRVYCCVGPEQF